MNVRLLSTSFCLRKPGVRNGHRNFWISLGAAAVLTGSAWLHAAGEAQALEPDLDRLLGTYRFVGGQEEVRKVERAIDKAVDEMNVFIRGIARRRLKEPNLPTDELRISLTDGAITVARTGQPAISAPATGERITWRNPTNGNELEVTHRITKEGALEQKLIGDRGTSRNVFGLRKDRQVEMKTTITADKLPSTIRFATTYARK